MDTEKKLICVMNRFDNEKFDTSYDLLVSLIY